MRIVHRPGRHELAGDRRRAERIVTLDVDDPSATVGELSGALSAQATVPAAGLVVDGRWYPPTAPVAEVALHVGSVVEPALTPPTTPPTPARVLAVVGGLRAGGVSPLEGPTTIGRGGASSVPIADPTVARHQMVVDRDHVVADGGATNPVLVDGSAVRHAHLAPDSVITAGATQLCARVVIDDRPLAVREGLGRRAGLLPFNRPPRVAPATEPASLTVPAEPAAPDPVEPPSLAALILPVLAGAVMAMVFSPFMAIFTALGPLLTIGTWWERRRRSRRSHRRAVRAVEAAAADVATTLDSRRDDERARRRRLVPDPAEVVRRARSGSVRLWERSPADGDAWMVGVGVRSEPFSPRLDAGDGAPAQLVVETIAEAAPLTDVPIPIVLEPGTTLGIVGPVAARQSVGRAIALQLAVHHGPAHLAVCAVAEPDLVSSWSWTTWLPHAIDRATGDAPTAAIEVGDGEQLAARLQATDTTHLVVLDGNTTFEGRNAPGRRATATDHAVVVALVDDTHRLPAGCQHIVMVDEFGRITLLDPRVDAPGEAGLAWGIDAEVAADAARHLARFDDPELECAGAGVPDRADLLGLLGIDSDPAEIEARWARTRGTAGLVAPIGRDAEGPVLLDLVADGPHLLVGGTTGAGKSELLRSIVASLAATADPDHVSFVLVDYKGGAAFDCCAELPHVAGLVTDLDADLAARALRGLDAELHRRERLLRSVGAEDLAAYRAASAGRGANAEPLPRLVLVVDEFASLAADLPEFLDALVGIAQRGRSLGVHMILATQRPAGVVTDDIRANTGCRIALRVTGRHESADIIDAPDAAAIPRTRPGRAVARFGPGELIGFQSALSTGHSTTHAAIRVESQERAASAPDCGPNDLTRLVDAIRTAHGDRLGPQAPWPEPLPVLGTATPDGWWLVDRPDEQCQTIEGWAPGDGHLVVLGGPGSGVSTTLIAAACRAIDAGAHVHAIDLDAGLVTGLADLPAVGTVADPVDPERRVRLLRWLVEEIERRRGTPTADHQPLVLVIDDLGGLARAHDPIREPAPHDHLAAVWADGPAVGVTVVVGLRRAAELPPALAAGTGAMLAHRVLDPGDAHRFGIRAVPVSMPPGRAVRAGDGNELHVLIPDGDVGSALAARRSVEPAPAPTRIGTLAADIALDDLLTSAPATGDQGVLRLPVGRADADLAPAVLELHRGDHVLVIGPSRSGRTTTLETITRSAVAAGRPVLVVADAASALADRLAMDPVSSIALASADVVAGTLVIVDDALDVGDAAGQLSAFVAGSEVHVVAAARPDRLRNAYGHWTQELRAGRAGLLLQPDPLDGDLLGASLPGRLDLAPLPGRGMIVAAGRHAVVHVARHRGGRR